MLVRLVLQGLQLRLLSEHPGAQRDPREGHRRDDDEVLAAVRLQNGISEGLQLQEDGLPEEVLRVLQCGNRLRK